MASASESPDRVTVALVQMACGSSKRENVEKAAARIAAAASQGAQIVCLQELFAGRYPCQSEDAARCGDAEPIPGPTTEALSAAARRSGVVVVAGSIFERRAPGLYHNTAVVLDADGALLGCYRKMHIPDDPFYYEKFYFTPGDLGFRSFATRRGRIGVGVCWDQWFPEAARLIALSGARILFYPTAIGALVEEEEEEHEAWRIDQSAWETMMRSHAIANGVYVAAANRVGREGALRFWGASFAADPRGRVLAQASGEEEETLLVACEWGEVESARRSWPFLRDRRVDAYGGLTQRYLDESS